MASYGDHLSKMTTPRPQHRAPTPEDLALSIGCLPEHIVRSERHKVKSAMREDGKDVWTSFVEQADAAEEGKVAVYETVWPQ